MPAAAAALIPIAARVVGGMVLSKVLGGVMGGGKSAAQGALTPGPPNPHLQSPTAYTMGNQASYIAGRGFRPG